MEAERATTEDGVMMCKKQNIIFGIKQINGSEIIKK
jgi:hypothetical protein